MSLYELFLFLHIAAAVVWVGGATAIQLLGMLVERSGDGRRMAAFAKDAEWVGMRIFTPASLAVLGFGFALVYEVGFAYSLWIWFALVAFAGSFLVGIGFLGPESGRIAKAIEAEGPDSADAARRIRRIFLVSRIELIVLWLIVLAMAAKPTLDDVGLVLAGLVAFAVLAVLAVRSYLGASRPTPAPALE